MMMVLRTRVTWRHISRQHQSEGKRDDSVATTREESETGADNGATARGPLERNFVPNEGDGMYEDASMDI